MCESEEGHNLRIAGVPGPQSAKEARELYLRLRRRLRIAGHDETCPPTLCGDRERIRAAKAREIHFGRQGSWLYDANRLVALRQAEALLNRVLAARK